MHSEYTAGYLPALLLVPWTSFGGLCTGLAIGQLCHCRVQHQGARPQVLLRVSCTLWLCMCYSYAVISLGW